MKSGRPKRRKVRQRLRRGAYLLPSLFTTGNILMGFYAVVLGTRGQFATAALVIFIAGILDGLDGRIARMTNTVSDFGREFDSLADLFTFGVAPALLAYFWGLERLGRIGWLIPLYFLICTAVRLARFNVQTKVVDSRFFVGLPSPAAAGFIGSFLFIAPDSEWKAWLEGAMLVALVGIGTLMVSTFRYPSFKNFDLRQRWSYRVILPWAVGLLALAFHPPAFFLTAAVVYTLMGPTSWLVGRLRRRGAKKKIEEHLEIP
ncbi:MAG: CDP-diacylglycerol--serine O-phosphatidyltransferase [bacterium]|nr:CDP-diacylglycerol--serine O-phosphatidyltransferase [bacterium]